MISNLTEIYRILTIKYRFSVKFDSSFSNVFVVVAHGAMCSV